MRRYRYFTAEYTDGTLVDVLVDEESFEGKPSEYFLAFRLKGDVNDQGIVEMDGPNIDSLPDVMESENAH